MAKDTDDHDAALESRIASGLHFADKETGAVIPPIHLATTYARDTDYALPDPGVGYSRDQNPTYRVPERMLAALEAGADALLFASGVAAAPSREAWATTGPSTAIGCDAPVTSAGASGEAAVSAVAAAASVISTPASRTVPQLLLANSRRSL